MEPIRVNAIYKQFGLIAFLMLAGCVTQSSGEPFECGVANFDGELTDGLVTPTLEMKEHFLSQLEERDRDWPYCWYQTADGRIELSLGDFGHFFVFDGESWSYDEKQTYIILWHERKPGQE